MKPKLHVFQRAAFVVALLALAATQAQAHATAQPLSISGNWLVAIAVALVALWSVILLIRGVLFIDERDAWLRRGGGDGNDWWFSD